MRADRLWRAGREQGRAGHVRPQVCYLPTEPGPGRRTGALACGSILNGTDASRSVEIRRNPDREDLTFPDRRLVRRCARLQVKLGRDIWKVPTRVAGSKQGMTFVRSDSQRKIVADILGCSGGEMPGDTRTAHCRLIPSATPDNRQMTVPAGP